MPTPQNENPLPSPYFNNSKFLSHLRADRAKKDTSVTLQTVTFSLGHVQFGRRQKKGLASSRTLRFDPFLGKPRDINSCPPPPTMLTSILNTLIKGLGSSCVIITRFHHSHSQLRLINILLCLISDVAHLLLSGKLIMLRAL